MIKMSVLYDPPTDPTFLENYYRTVHAPMAAKLPGLRRYEWGMSQPGPDGAPGKYALVADLWFDDQAAMDAALASSVGAESVADLANFAGAGVAFVITEVTDQPVG